MFNFTEMLPAIVVMIPLIGLMTLPLMLMRADPVKQALGVKK
jgi:hypothetical protein